MREQYTFVDFQKQPELLEDLQKLEQKIEQQLGRTVNLIAYTPDPSNEPNHQPTDANS